MQSLLLWTSVALAALSLLPFIRSERWWIRILDFPRVQLATLAAAALVGWLLVGDDSNRFYLGLSLATIALIVQLASIAPYTRLWRQQTKDAAGGHPSIRLLMANVQMDNRESEGLFAFIAEQQPDLIVLDEPDGWWEQQFERIEADYPYAMRDARSNTYGMLLYSRRPFESQQHRFIIEQEIPSFHVQVKLGSRPVNLHFIHPKPPSPQEATATTGRDAELVIVGREAAAETVPSIVAGDLNDVAWSHTTRLFQRISGLLDPRRGRGMYNTFHARIFFLRWPLDHLFHSQDFRLVRMVRGPAFGSDHFPMLVELELDPSAPSDQPAPQSDRGDRQEAAEKVESAARKPDPDA